MVTIRNFKNGILGVAKDVDVTALQDAVRERKYKGTLSVIRAEQSSTFKTDECQNAEM